jgi:O-antigen/teichoic acid export membrane protein
MLGFSGWNLFGSFSGVMQEQGINLVINSFFGPVVNAARGVAAQVNGGLSGFISNITVPVRPQVVQSYARGEIQRTMNLTYSISKLSCGFLMVFAIPISIEIEYVLHLWLGNTVPEHTASFTIIILASSLISNLNSATSNVVHATGRMKDYQLWGSIIKVSSVPISYFVLCYYARPELALIIVFICRTIGHIVCLFIVRTLIEFPLRYYFIQVILPLLFVLAIGIGVSFPLHVFMSPGFFRLLCVSIVGGTSVLLAMYFICLNRREKDLAKQLLFSAGNHVSSRFHRTQ